MINSKFCHLHLHSMYSQLDGLGAAKKYVAKAKEMGFEYLGCTDHGNVDGLIKWQKECDKQGIKPVLGCEAYIVPNAKFKNKGEKRGHITMLVKNAKGWHELCRLLTYANVEGFYSRPRIDYDILLNCDLSGFVIMTACAGSFLKYDQGGVLLQGLIDKKADVYYEIMPHDIRVQYEIHDIIRKMQNIHNFPLCASNDCHYINEDEWKAQEVLLAIQRKVKWDDPKRWSFGFKGLHLRSADEMLQAFKKHDFIRGEVFEAMFNSVEIAKKCCDFRIPKRDISLPPVTKEWTEEDHYDELEKLTKAQLNKLTGFGEGKELNEIERDDYRKRLDFELNVIKEKRFATYFLIVYELINWCRDNNIMVGPGRGSSGGSLIAYLLNITQVNPIKYGLLFERFISIDRQDYPDIDIDVEDTKRDLIRVHLEKIYGFQNIASISTFDMLKSRSAVRDVARVFDIPYREIDEFAKAINTYETIKDGESYIQLTVDKKTEGQRFYKKYPEIVDLSIKLEGQIRQSSQHAAALIVSNENLTESDRCNLCYRSQKVVVNWDMEDSEYVGLMKLDVLGLKTLTVLNETKRMVKENYGIEIVFEDIALDDTMVFDEINGGNTIGIFQITGGPTTDLAVRLGIHNFDDMVAVGALVRPGAMDSGMTDTYIERKHGIPKGKTWKRKHDIYEKITKDTYGVPIYQEQIMYIISEVAGLPFSTANRIRKIIGKKRDPKEFEQYWEMFLQGCLDNRTMDESEAEEFWETLQAHANYSFNLSHSVEYALIGYWTGWCKANYPTEFICALLTYGAKSKIEETISEANRMGLKLVPPKIGISHSHNWVAVDGKLYIPFVEVKGIGDAQAKILSGEKTVKKQRGGFFTQEEINAPIVKPGSSMDETLKAIGAYDEKGYPEGAASYFDFPLSSDPDTAYPKLFDLFGPGDDYDSLIAGDSVDFQHFIKGGYIYRNKDILNCQTCGLAKECIRPVLPSIGSTNIVICGEAPGKEEDKEGKGFIGKAGCDVLWPELEKHGLKRRKFHVTNVCKCFPSKSKKPDKKHIYACMPWLEEELANIECRLMLGLGGTVLQAFTGRASGITELSGTTEWVEEYGVWICWCIHPLSVLYDRSNREIFENGIKNFANKII